MSRVRTDLGRRAELVPMDSRFEDISVALYVRDDGDDGHPVGTVHSYSSRPGTAERVATIAGIVCGLGGLEAVGDAGVRFPCGAWHRAAAKRLFIEACRHDPSTPAVPGSLEAPDTRSGQLITVVPRGGGSYEVVSTGATDEAPSRAPAIARAIAKLAELDIAEEGGTVIAFPCGHPHDQLVALLLRRAQNLRQILREEEMQASRGVLSAPSAQE